MLADPVEFPDEEHVLVSVINRALCLQVLPQPLAAVRFSLH